MSNSSAKKTNQMLGEQRNRANLFSSKMGGYGEEDRAYQTGQRNRISDEYWNMYNEGGGGGGGGGWSARENEAMPFYRDWMKSGGYSDEDRRDWRSRSEAVIPSFYAGIKRNMDEASQIRGGYAGYSGQLAKAAREGAQQAEAGRLAGEVELQGNIRRNRVTGAGGVERLDRELMADQRSAAGSAASAGQQGFRDRMSILGQLRDLRGEGGSDLAYWDRDLAGQGLATRDVTERVPETPWWQTALNMAVPAASSFFSGGLSGIGGGGGGRRRQSSGGGGGYGGGYG